MAERVTCAKCGAPLQQDVDKCVRCGAPRREVPAEPAPPKVRHSFDSVCGGCGALLPAGCEACLVCGTARGAAVYTGEFPVPVDGETPPAYPSRGSARSARKTPDVWRRWGGGVSAALLLALMVMAGLGVYQRYFDTSGYRAAEAVVYESADRKLMVSHPGLEQPRMVAGVNRPTQGFAQGALRASPNGRWIAYTEDTGELYLIDLAQRGMAESDALNAVWVARDVAEPAVFSKNSEYLVYRSRSGELFASNYTENWRLDTSVREVLAVDDRKVLYTRAGDQGDQVDLYLDYLPRDGGEWLLIDRNVTQVLDWTRGFERMLYTSVRQNDQGADSASLWLFELGEQGKSTTTALAAGIGKVLDASAETATAVYLVPRPQPWSYDAFIDDDLAGSDKAMTEPDLEDYPLVAAAIAIYGEGGEFTDSEENEELVEENQRYREALLHWEEKQERELVRQHLHYIFVTMSNPLVLNELYVYQNGSVTLVDSGVYETGDLTPGEGRVSVDKGYVAYQKIDPDSLTKMKMSAVWERADMQDPNLRDYFFRNTQRELLYFPFGGKPARVYIRTGGNMFQQWRVAPQADGVYFTVGSSTQRDILYYSPLRAGVPGAAVQVERDVEHIDWPLRDGVVFLRGDRANPQLCFAQGGAPRILGGTGAAPFEPVNDGNTLLYMDNYQSQTATGSLHMVAKEERFVAGDVLGFEYHSDDLIYLFKRGGGQNGAEDRDIFVWQGGQSGREVLVARSARSVLGIPADEND